MFKNYFKTAWRNLKKRKVFSFINLIGLATGMAVCLLLGLLFISADGNKSLPGSRPVLAAQGTR